MNLIKTLILFTSISLFSNIYATAEKYESRYTSLNAKECITLLEENESIVQECPGFAGYQLHISEFDLRQSITLLKAGKEYLLEFPRAISPAFSSLGAKAEWRFIGSSRPLKPIALIVRFDTAKDGESDKTTSWLVVSKITDKDICVVGKISPQTDGSQNQKARDMADQASEMPCLLSEAEV